MSLGFTVSLSSKRIVILLDEIIGITDTLILNQP